MSCPAQIGSTTIAAVGFGGYDHPKGGFNNCAFCTLSNGKHAPLFKGIVPTAGTEGEFVASVIGCTCAPSPLL